MAAERRKCRVEEPMFLMGQNEIIWCIAACYVVSPKPQGRLSKKRHYWLADLGRGSSIPSSLSIPVYGLRAPRGLGEWHRLVIVLYAAVRAVSASQSKAARRPLLKGAQFLPRLQRVRGNFKSSGRTENLLKEEKIFGGSRKNGYA